MKNPLLTLLFVISWNIQAQNWEPFPYDSVFFEPGELNEFYMPFVKTTDGQIRQTNHISLFADRVSSNAFETYYTSKVVPWIGKIEYSNPNFSFITTFEDTLTLNLTPQNTTDTILFNIQYDSVNTSQFSFNLEVTKETSFSTTVDSLITFTFHTLDTNYNSINLNDYINCSESIDNLQLEISKTKGIIKTPDFGFFPFCKQFELGSGIIEELDSLHFSNRVNQMNIGDELHTIEGMHISTTFTRFHSKYIVTSSTFSTSLDAYINVYDVWMVREEGQFVSPTTTTYHQFTQVDTIANMQSYNELLDGMYLNWYDSIGYFYSISEYDELPSLTAFRYNGGMPYHIDTASNSIRYDANILDAQVVDIENYYFGLSQKFFFKSADFERHSKNIRYFKTQTNEWGDPYTDPFLLETPEYESRTTYYINNNNLFWESELEVNKARIYDIQGKLVSVYDSASKSDQINIEHLTYGTYFLVLKSNTNTVNIKFVK